MTYKVGDKVTIPNQHRKPITGRVIDIKGDLMTVKLKREAVVVPKKYVIGTYDEQRVKEILDVVGWRLDLAWRKQQ